MDEAIMRNIVRIGIVYDVDTENSRVRVHFPNLNITSGWLSILKTIDPWLPSIDDKVVCLYLPVFNGDGFILGVIQ